MDAKRKLVGGNICFVWKVFLKIVFEYYSCFVEQKLETQNVFNIFFDVFRHILKIIFICIFVYHKKQVNTM